MKMILQDKRAPVTEASVGIGRAMAKALAQRGVAVAIAARRRQTLAEVAEEIAGAGHRRPVVLRVNLGKRGAAARWLMALLQRKLDGDAYHPAKGERDG